MVTRVVEEIAKYKNITDHTETIDKTKMYTLDNYVSKDINEVVTSLQQLGLNTVPLGNGKYITKQYPLAKQVILNGDKIFLITNGDLTLPDFTGYSSNEAITLCKLLGVTYKVVGHGKVLSQNMPAGTAVSKDYILEFQLG